MKKTLVLVVNVDEDVLIDLDEYGLKKLEVVIDDDDEGTYSNFNNVKLYYTISEIVKLKRTLTLLVDVNENILVDLDDYGLKKINVIINDDAESTYSYYDNLKDNLVYYEWNRIE